MNLQLPLIRQWFEMTKAGIKTEDYREINEYWLKRMLTKSDYGFYLGAKHGGGNEFECNTYDIDCAEFKPFKINTMTLGYPKKTNTDRILRFEHKGIHVGTGKPEWGAEPDKLYFVIKHGKALDIRENVK